LLKLSFSELTTPHTSFDQDLVLYPSAGARGIGLYEPKLPPAGGAGPAKLREAGLTATLCIPTVPSVLPDAFAPEPADMRERTQSLERSIDRFAAYGRVVVIVAPGDREESIDRGGRPVLVDALHRLSERASEVGVLLAVEPLRQNYFAHDIPSALELLDDVGAGRDEFGILIDIWHLWNSAKFLDLIPRVVSRCCGVHLADWRTATRTDEFDRGVPGEGIIPLAQLLAVLQKSGYDGWYDVEILSDDGTLGTDHPDSLWKLPPSELLRRCAVGVEQAWASAEVLLRR
jgi:sugar phosphate isomerase/epimerase